MPYIKKQNRIDLLMNLKPLDCGELNYLIHTICLDFLERKGLNYFRLNEIIGVLECVKQELYRRVGGPYEDKKIKENGDLELYDKIIRNHKLFTEKSKCTNQGSCKNS